MDKKFKLTALLLCTVVMAFAEEAAKPVDVGLTAFFEALHAGKIKDGKVSYPSNNSQLVYVSGNYATEAATEPVNSGKALVKPAAMWSSTGYITTDEALELRKLGFKQTVGFAALDQDNKAYVKEREAAAKIEASGHPWWVRAWTVTREIVSSSLFINIILLVVVFFFLKKALMGGLVKTPKPAKPKDRKTFSDVAGCDEAKEEVSEIVDYLKDPKKFTKLGGRMPKGVLLVGPPGTGKTLLARAVAGEARVPFFNVSGSDFIEMYVGVGASRVRKLFAEARKNAPCIIFIDEIDAIGGTRASGDGGGHSEHNQTLNAILTNMDGFEGREGIVVFAATNRVDTLDNALRRPGRFDRQVQVDLPDIKGREAILKIYLNGIKADASLKADAIAQMTVGFSGAELANLVNEAAIHAGRNEHNEVQISDFDEARDKIAMGRERRKSMTQSELLTIACHEGGHALMQILNAEEGMQLQKVTIIPRGQSLGSTHFAPERDMLNSSREQLEARLRCLMGGRIAEEIIMGRVTSGAAGDIQQATRIARTMVLNLGMSELGFVAVSNGADCNYDGIDSPETRSRAEKYILELINRLYGETRELLLKNRDYLEAITQALMEKETISGADVRALCSPTLRAQAATTAVQNS
ncbi:MAG TPA: ATP-dependent zinc metalloprotease FtsH [Opitutaceae bacterium]|nr:ATP-dependent zinc metalloprotease FtsH [Opitutaceae bacterium]